MDEIIYNILELICSSTKLDRDKGIAEFDKFLTAQGILDEHLTNSFQKYLVDRLMNSESSWEVKYGCLQASKSAVRYITLNPDFIYHIQTLATHLLTDGDKQVRHAAGQVLGVLCYKAGIYIYSDCKEFIFKLIHDYLTKIMEMSLNRKSTEDPRTEKSIETEVDKRVNEESIHVVYDTSSSLLETSLEALQSMAHGCGNNFVPFIDEELMALSFKILDCENHFIRVKGFEMLSTLLQCCAGESPDSMSNFNHKLCHYLSEGLADNSSQVRLSASVTTRYFLLSLSEEPRQSFYAQLLPRMCLNRYHVADGVRIYSQETWRQVTSSTGRDLVQRYIEPTVAYYETAATADKQGIREAACACIAELASKLPPDTVRPYVKNLLTTLLLCFDDDCWTVRDAACLACENFIVSFPTEMKIVLVDIYPMFFRNLGDPIPCVRRGAASALSTVVRVYGESSLSPILDRVKDGFEGMQKQEATDEKYEFEAESMKRGRDYVSSRKFQPWEFADGCVYLLGELSNFKEAHMRIISLLSKMKEAASYKHYAQHVTFLETICKQLPTIAKNLGRKAFSNIVEEFFDDIFYALESENGLTSSAASQCVNQLAAILGQNILRTKVANYHPRYLTALESVIYVAPF